VKKESGGEVRRIEISGELDRHAAEALQLELRRLARRHGIDVREARVEKLDEETSA
jgi:type IV pilus biogenesis protein CpaD/CtpE